MKPFGSTVPAGILFNALAEAHNADKKPGGRPYPRRTLSLVLIMPI
jgi:hypothetical protein